MPHGQLKSRRRRPSVVDSDEPSPRRADVYEILRTRIMHGKLAPGEGIRENPVAKQLGVSRTPLREALFRLEREGLIRSVMNRGFSVAPFSMKEIREALPILASLECLALRTQGIFVSSAVPELISIQSALSDAGKHPIRWLELDGYWHHALVSNCSNRKLVELIEQLRPLTFRAHAIVGTEMQLFKTSDQHRSGIISALKGGVPDLAIELLQRHWNYRLEWLLHRAGEL
jgi:DNA-binding GntR family transcriptional regulator